MTGPDEAAGVAIIKNLLEAEQQGLRARPVQMGPYSLYMVICALQLAFRHPEVNPKLKQVWRDTGEQFMQALDPAARAILDRGWYQDFDQ